MRTETIELYKFNELSEESKQKAIERYRETNFDLIGHDEILDSFKATFKALNIPIKDYSLDLNQSYVKFDIDKKTGELTGVRALAWLENNLFNDLRITRKEYLKDRKKSRLYGYKIGHIKDCPLTGCCYDENFLDSLKECILKNYTLQEAIENLAYVYQKLLNQECAW